MIWNKQPIKCLPYAYLHWFLITLTCYCLCSKSTYDTYNQQKMNKHTELQNVFFSATQKKLSHPKSAYVWKDELRAWTVLCVFFPLFLVNHKAVLRVCERLWTERQIDAFWVWLFWAWCCIRPASLPLFSAPLYMKPYTLSNTLVQLERIKHRCVCVRLRKCGGITYTHPAVQPL